MMLIFLNAAPPKEYSYFIEDPNGVNEKQIEKVRCQHTTMDVHPVVSSMASEVSL